MKKTWMLVVAMMITVSLWADPIGRGAAQQMAADFLLETTGRQAVLAPVTQGRKLAPARPGVSAAEPAYYVFNRGEGQGFIIVSGDDAAPMVLGYCDEGDFDYSRMPVNMRSWLNHYEEQILDLRTTGRKAPRRAEKHPRIDELLTCTWDQGSPYNDECPMYFGRGRSVTGCVATAMAQILYYQRAKSTDRTLADMPAYDGTTADATYGKLHVEGIAAGEPLDWANMRDHYSGGESAVQKTAVAKLMHCCGVAVEMDYTNSASGAQSFKIPDALRNYFGYGNSVRIVSMSSYTNDEWDALLYNELAEGRPFYLSGANASVGHAFVCDGYDGNHYYHINWGWGGTSNGHYLLTNLTPGAQGTGGSDSGYNSYVEAVIGMEPENFVDKAMPFDDVNVRKLCAENWGDAETGTISYGQAAAVTGLGQVFTGGSTLRYFKELRNFTSLTAISDRAFDGCRQLMHIILPKGITSIGTKAFNGNRTLRDFQLPKGITVIGDSAFTGCRSLTAMELPEGVTRIGDGTFEACASITAMDIPAGVTAIGSRAFASCTKLTEVEVHVADPSLITLGTDVFAGMKLANATLIVAEGGKALFSEAEQWKEFGTIKERRVKPEDSFSPLAVQRLVYLYNVGTGRYLTKGEAYGTQAVAGVQPMRFVLRHRDDMPADTYEIFSDEASTYYHLLYRQSEDEQVGTGVKATFVDGRGGTEALWTIKAVGDNTYTIQSPTTAPDYRAAQFLGILPTHASNVASPTYGAYYDITYATNKEACQWRFIDVEECYGAFNAANTLEKLIARADLTRTYVEQERAILEDMGSSYEDLKRALKSVRGKLNLIDFTDPFTEFLCIRNFDMDSDGELSFSEAAMTQNIGQLFYQSNIREFPELEHFGIDIVYGQGFADCNELRSIKLPPTLTTAYYYGFLNCSQLEELELPAKIAYLGFQTFQGCSKLRTLRVANPNPETISIFDTTFEGLDCSKVTLYVPYGSKEKYAAAAGWSQFFDIQEYRTDVQAQLSPIETATNFYVYNIGTQRYLNRGEAYGTQSVVADQGLRYQLMRTNSMPENTYYLQSPDLSSSGKVLFRTTSDTKVGEGVKACFVDGSVSVNAYWVLTEVGDNIYTITVPQKSADAEPQYLGIDTFHDSGVIYPTYGTYWDIDYESHTANCHWALISEADMQLKDQLNAAARELKELLELADARDIDVVDERAVYNNMSSTVDELKEASSRVRVKLGLIEFEDAVTEKLCLNYFDANLDGTLTFEEAASVSDLGAVFNGASTLRIFPELRYFTSLETIGVSAFQGCTALQTLFFPATLKAIESKAFMRCTKLKYIAMPEGLLSTVAVAEDASLPLSGLHIFTNPDDVAPTMESGLWSKYNVSVYTGIPVVTANDATSIYGRKPSSFSYGVEGAPIDGEPTFSCEATAASPVGTYDIVVEPGTIKTKGVTYCPGTLTVTPSELTVTAKSYTRKKGEPNPEFELTYTRFWNGDKVTSLIAVPVAECDADEHSPEGEYEIRVSGGEALNYSFVYVSGTLKVEGIADAIEQVEADGEGRDAVIYDLQGRRLRQEPLKGVYIKDGKKVVK